MAVEYDKWTDARDINLATANEIKELIGDKFAVSYNSNHYCIRIEPSNACRVDISNSRYESDSEIVTNYEAYYWTSKTVSKIRYYAKRSGEVLIASVDEGDACAQVAIGKCSDGDWGITAVGKMSTDNAYDTMFLLGKNMPPYAMKFNVTNSGMPNKMFLSIRNVVLREDITFDNIYVNNYGYTDPFTIIEMNGERYACANGTTGNHVCLMMKL